MDGWKEGWNSQTRAEVPFEHTSLRIIENSKTERPKNEKERDDSLTKRVSLTIRNTVELSRLFMTKLPIEPPTNRLLVE